MMKILLAVLLCSSAMAAAPPDYRRLDSFTFDSSLPLPRVRTIPPALLERWAKLDGHPYKNHVPTAPESKVLSAAVAGLPAPMRKVLSERLIAVYLVDGLQGNGVTDWVLDASSRTYVYMILNPRGFKQNLSELLTERDSTLFRGKPDLRVEAGTAPGIFYTVSHESAHAVDYVLAVTPFTEPGLGEVSGRAGRYPDGWDVWHSYAQPRGASDYPLRAKLHFYGFGSPELDVAQTGDLCAQWAKSPFASFYGSRSWAEDLAELFVLRHLTQDLQQPLRRVCVGKSYVPWDNPSVRKRAENLLKPLYR